DEAEDAFREAVRRKPESPGAHGWLGRSLMFENPPEAETHFREAIRLNHGNVYRTYVGLGIALGGQGRYPDAEAAFRKAIRLAPTETAASLYGLLGTTLLNQGKPDKAEAAYREAIQLDPIQRGSLPGQGLDRQDRTAQKEAAFRKATWGHAARRCTGLGLALERQGKPDEAEAAFREAIRTDERARVAAMEARDACRLANMLMSHGRFKDALAVLRQASTLMLPDEGKRMFDAALRRAERRVAMAPRLPAVLAGAARPPSGGPPGPRMRARAWSWPASASTAGGPPSRPGSSPTPSRPTPRWPTTASPPPLASTRPARTPPAPRRTPVAAPAGTTR